jgi:glutamine synthetase
MAEYKTYEYIWLDGNKPESSMRSKVKATDADTPPDWSFDGSSTGQADAEAQTVC